MQINGINGTGSSAAKASVQPVDAVSKSIQNQIANAQLQLQKLSSDPEMSMEEKQQRRQEIQKQIAEWNTQLRQRQVELRRKQQAQDSSSEQEVPALDAAAEERPEVSGALTDSGMKAILSAEASLSQAEAHGTVASSLAGKVRVLEGEIKQSERQGNDTESKQNELEALQARLTRTSGARAGMLSDAVQDMRQAAKRENAGSEERSTVKAPEDKFAAAKKLNLAAGSEAYQKGKFYADVSVHVPVDRI